MFSQEELRDLTGATAYDHSGQKIGTVTSIYWDQATDVPEWLTVKTGLFGMKETFVPLALVQQASTNEVTFAADKDTRLRSRNAATSVSRSAQIRLTSDLEIPLSAPRALTRSPALRVEVPRR